MAEGYKGEVARLEALLAEKDLALNQAQADLSAAQSEVVCWHRSSAENEKRAKGRNCVFSLSPFYIWIDFPDFCVFSVLFFNRVGEEDGRGNLCRRGLAEVP